MLKLLFRVHQSSLLWPSMDAPLHPTDIGNGFVTSGQETPYSTGVRGTASNGVTGNSAGYHGYVPDHQSRNYGADNRTDNIKCELMSESSVTATAEHHTQQSAVRDYDRGYDLHPSPQHYAASYTPLTVT